jgi:hypothetical protein
MINSKFLWAKLCRPYWHIIQISPQVYHTLCFTLWAWRFDIKNKLSATVQYNRAIYANSVNNVYKNESKVFFKELVASNVESSQPEFLAWRKRSSRLLLKPTLQRSKNAEKNVSLFFRRYNFATFCPLNYVMKVTFFHSSSLLAKQRFEQTISWKKQQFHAAQQTSKVDLPTSQTADGYIIPMLTTSQHKNI